MVKYNPDEVFAALGHPVRRQMAERLARERKLSMSELARPFSMSLPAAKKHIDFLEASGIVMTKKEGRVKYCAINMEAFLSALDWFRFVEQLWEGRLDRLERYLAKTK